MNASRIGQKLVQLRGEKSQKDVSSDLKISRSALGMYEQGQRIPRDPVKMKIAQYYGVSIEDLFFNA